MSHPSHPKCGTCGKPLFKSPQPAKVRPADPWAYCRNPNCQNFCGADGIVSTGTPAVLQPKVAKADSALLERAKGEGNRKPLPRRARPAQGVPPTKPKGPVEPEHVRIARERLRKLVEHLIPDRDSTPPASIGLTLAILNQETGCHKAANSLIDEFELDKKFGLQKFVEGEHGKIKG